ncbi:MAG: DUF4340 domain-containing protein [Thermodesulfobacteriota bacterium]
MNLRPLLILLGLLVLLSGAVFYFLKFSTKALEEKRPQLWSLKEDQIEGLQIDLPQEKRSVAFFLGKNEKWYFKDQPEKEVERQRWGGVPTLVSGPKAKRMIAETSGDLRPFGLNPPYMIVTLGIRNQKVPLIIQFGNQTPQGDQYYVKIKGQPAIYIMPKEYCDVLMRLAQDPPYPPAAKSIEGKKDRP